MPDPKVNILYVALVRTHAAFARADCYVVDSLPRRRGIDNSIEPPAAAENIARAQLQAFGIFFGVMLGDLDRAAVQVN